MFLLYDQLYTTIKKKNIHYDFSQKCDTREKSSGHSVSQYGSLTQGKMSHSRVLPKRSLTTAPHRSLHLVAIAVWGTSISWWLYPPWRPRCFRRIAGDWTLFGHTASDGWPGRRLCRSSRSTGGRSSRRTGSRIRNKLLTYRRSSAFAICTVSFVPRICSAAEARGTFDNFEAFHVLPSSRRKEDGPFLLINFLRPLNSWSPLKAIVGFFTLTKSPTSTVVSLAALRVSVYRLLFCCFCFTRSRRRWSSEPGSAKNAADGWPTTSSRVLGNLLCRRRAGALPVVTCGVHR